MKTGKIRKQTKKLTEDKLIINSITDLLKIPINKIYNSKIENFSGIYFDNIYEEAIKSESRLEESKSSNSKKIQINNKNLKQNEKEVLSRGLIKENNKEFMKNKINDKNYINLKHYYEEDEEIPPNMHRTEYNHIKINNPTDLYPKDDDTQDNDVEVEKNEKINPESIQNFQDLIIKRKNSQIPIDKIIFSINYNSTFGEEVAILGTLSKLGFWKLNGAFPLKWNEGNIWTGEINIEDEDYQNFEFKFIVIEHGKIKRWEEGENNLVIFEELINNILSNKIGRYNKYKYEYNKNEATLYIKCHWH